MVQNGARLANGKHAAPPTHIFSTYMSCIVADGNGVSMGAEKKIGHIGGGSMVGTTWCLSHNLTITAHRQGQQEDGCLPFDGFHMSL